jgi:hypothetical protein
MLSRFHDCDEERSAVKEWLLEDKEILLGEFKQHQNHAAVLQGMPVVLTSPG